MNHIYGLAIVTAILPYIDVPTYIYLTYCIVYIQIVTDRHIFKIIKYNSVSSSLPRVHNSAFHLQ